MDLNIITITYLFLRLAPFVLVCFFSLSSLLNQDFKGLIYLIGLIFGCFITIIFGNVLTFIPNFPPEQRPEMCSIFSITNRYKFLYIVLDLEVCMPQTLNIHQPLPEYSNPYLHEFYL